MDDIPLPPSSPDADDSDSLPPSTRNQFKDLCPLLERLGIATVTIEYDGASDEGTFEEIVFDPQPQLVPPGLKEALEEAALELLSPGWEINEGSYGQFILDVAARLLSHHHEWWETVSEDMELEL